MPILMNREMLNEILTAWGHEDDHIYEWDVEVVDDNQLPLVQQALAARGARNIRLGGDLTLRVDSVIQMNFDGITGIVRVKEVKAG